MKITWIQPYYDLILYHVPIDTESLIDVGSGYGVFGYILSKARDIKRLISIEPFDYTTSHYNEQHKMTWGEYYKTDPDPVDVIVSTEMIEHLTKEDALLFLQQVKKKAKTVIIATPFKFSDQDAYDDNDYQKHKCVLTVKDFEDHGYKVSLMGVWGGIASRYFATRFYYNIKISTVLKLLGVKPSNIIGVWKA